MKTVIVLTLNNYNLSVSFINSQCISTKYKSKPFFILVMMGGGLLWFLFCDFPKDKFLFSWFLCWFIKKWRFR